MAGKTKKTRIAPGAEKPGGIRNRVREVRRMRLGDLRPNPQNWRRHPDAQREAMRGVLDELGFAGVVLAYEPEDGGGLMTLDGHLRAEEAPDLEVDVAVLDLKDREAAYLLATHDPLSTLAEANADALDALLRGVNSGVPAVQEMLAGLADGYFDALAAASDDPDPLGDGGADRVPNSQYGVIVICDSERAQKDVYETLVADGYTCRVVCV